MMNNLSIMIDKFGGHGVLIPITIGHIGQDGGMVVVAVVTTIIDHAIMVEE
jgi:hypothetical protein